MSNLRDRLLLFLTSLLALLVYLLSVISVKPEYLPIDERLMTEELDHTDYRNLKQRGTIPREDEDIGDILKFFDELSLA